MKILVVEDNPGDFFLVREMLLEHELKEAEVVQAEDLSEAIRYLSNNSPQVILLDLSLPDSRGVETLHGLLRHTTNIAIIVLTGVMDQKIALQALKEGAEDYLVKGDFDSRLLEKTIRYSIERKGHSLLLEKSEEKYKELFNNNPLPMWAYYLDTLQILMVNQAAVSFYGYSSEEFSKMTIKDLWLQEDVPVLLEELSKVKKKNSGLYKSGTWRHTNKSGQMLEVEIVTHPIQNENLEAHLVVIYDVTERKQQESHRRLLESVIINANDSVMITQPLKEDLAQQSIIYVNEAFTRMTGYTMNEIRGQSPRILQGEKTDREQLGLVRKAIKEHAPIEVEVINYSRRGQEYWVVMNIVPVFSDKNELTHFVSVQRDITEKKNAELFLKKAKERYDLINKATSEIIWDWDLQTNKVFRNENFQLKFGYIFEEYTDNSEWEKLIHPDDRERVIKKLTQKLTDPSNNYWEDEYRLLRMNGEIAYLYDRGYIIYDEERNPVRMLGAMEDITSRKQLELEKDRMTDDLVQRNKDLEQFAYIISHNLRAPVANIMGFVELLKEESSEDERILFMDQLEAATQKLDTVIKDLNTVMQIRREISEVRESVDLQELVLDVMGSINRLIDKENVLIEYNFTEAPTLLTIKSYLQSIFYNLITNSIKYRKADEPPIIIIRSRKIDHDIEISFQDNGLGMDLEKLGERIYGLYKRFHFHVEGKGMGLFMTKNQIEALGGSIRVESQENIGTTFIIRIGST